MRITLQGEMLPSSTTSKQNDAGDVRQLKVALNRLGFYKPDEATGMTVEMDQHFRDALYAFQRAHTIPLDDIPGPRSATERVLNEELAAHDETARYIWRTVGDKKVRGEHAQRAGQSFSWADPPDGENPGEDYNCRCWAEPLNPPRHPWIDWAMERRENPAHQTTQGGKFPVPETPENPLLLDANAQVLWNGARTTVAACWSNASCRAWMIREGAKIILESHIPPPITLPAFPDAKSAPPKGGRERWKDSKGKIYEWDYKKGEVEVYDKTGKIHQGGFDPNTGKQRSKPVPGRRIEK